MFCVMLVGFDRCYFWFFDDLDAGIPGRASGTLAVVMNSCGYVVSMITHRQV